MIVDASRSAKSLAIACVPWANLGISYMPIGPFQKIVLLSCNTLLKFSIVFGPISTIILSFGILSTDTVLISALELRLLATITSTVIDPSLFEPTGIYIFPNNATITAGVSITFIIVAYNDEGRNMEVTDQAIFFIVMDAGGNWDNNTYTSENIGTWTVIGEYLNQISGTESWIVHATLIVEESHN